MVRVSINHRRWASSKQSLFFLPPHAKLTDELSVVCQRIYIPHIDDVTDMVSNSPAWSYQLSPLHLSIALPSSPGHPGSSMIDGDCKSPKKYAHRQTQKHLTQRGPCTY